MNLTFETNFKYVITHISVYFFISSSLNCMYDYLCMYTAFVFMCRLEATHVAKFCRINFVCLFDIYSTKQFKGQQICFPLFNNERYTFQIKNNTCVQGPFEIISR